MGNLKIQRDVMQVLDQAEMSGNNLSIAHLGQLDRKLYTDVDKVLKAIGGKWNRSAKAHVFDGPADDVIQPILETGEYSRTKQDLGQFDTPEPIVNLVIHLARIEPRMLVLEPSVGTGNLAAAAEALGAQVGAFEIDAKRLHAAKDRLSLDMGIRHSDFLSFKPEPIFDRVVMNPPFAKQADIDHVIHAMMWLKPGGRLVSVMSGGTIFRSNRKAVEFRAWVDSLGGTIEVLPSGSFDQSGTGVHTCVLVLSREG